MLLEARIILISHAKILNEYWFTFFQDVEY